MILASNLKYNERNSEVQNSLLGSPLYFFIPGFFPSLKVPSFVCCHFLSQSAQAAVTNTTEWGGLNNRNLFLTVLEPGSSRSRCCQVQFLLKPLSLTHRWLSLCCVLTQTFLCSCAPVSLLPVKTLALSNQRPTLMTSLNLNYIFKYLISKYSLIEDWGFNT